MPVTIEGKDFYSVLEAAKFLDVVPETVRGYIHSKKLKPVYAGKPILIRGDQLEVLKFQRSSNGKPQQIRKNSISAGKKRLSRTTK